MNGMSGGMRNTLLKDERLRAVFGLLGEAETVADIGCDHGYLSAALVLSGRAKRVIASDISPVSAGKAAALAESLGIGAQMEAVCANGLSCLTGGEPGLKIAVCGMGGELIAKILAAAPGVVSRAELVVMQPMRGEAELRRYLYENRFRITDERVVLDEGRYYQVIAAVPGCRDTIPAGFPEGMFRFGWVMASKPETELMPLLKHYRAVYLKELENAERRGRSPEKLIEEIEKTEALMRFAEGRRGGMKLSELVAAMERIAPRELALEYDNPGLIVGARDEEIDRVLVALDCTLPVVREAKEKGCRLVLTHHPLLFRAVKSITPSDPVTAPVYELIRNDIAMFAAHTNLDAAEGGVNTVLCRLLGIKNERPVPPEDICRVGELENEESFSEFARRVGKTLNAAVRAAGPERPVRRVMVCGGSGGSEYRLAAEAGADVLVTGECRHNEAIEAVHAGVNVLACGHFETESIVLKPLIERLEKELPGAEFILSEAGNPLRPLE